MVKTKQFSFVGFMRRNHCLCWMALCKRTVKQKSLPDSVLSSSSPALHALSLLSVCFAGLLPSSDGCGLNNDPTDGFIRGRLRQPAGGSCRGDQEPKRQELWVKRRQRGGK